MSDLDDERIAMDQVRNGFLRERRNLWSDEKSVSAGAKARVGFGAFSARLKPCPDSL
jgi:hypothetical protein